MLNAAKQKAQEHAEPADARQEEATGEQQLPAASCIVSSIGGLGPYLQLLLEQEAYDSLQQMHLLRPSPSVHAGDRISL